MKINSQAKPYMRPIFSAIIANGGSADIGDIADKLGVSVNIAWSAMSQLRKSGLITNYHDRTRNGEWFVRVISSKTNTRNSNKRLWIASAVSMAAGVIYAFLG